eukprot:1136208-Pelagomonas_calceolata.AAC.3
MEPGMEAISPCFYQQDSLHDTKKAHSTFKGPAAEPAPEKCVSLLGMGSVSVPKPAKRTQACPAKLCKSLMTGSGLWPAAHPMPLASYDMQHESTKQKCRQDGILASLIQGDYPPWNKPCVPLPPFSPPPILPPAPSEMHPSPRSRCRHCQAAVVRGAVSMEWGSGLGGVWYCTRWEGGYLRHGQGAETWEGGKEGVCIPLLRAMCVCEDVGALNVIYGLTEAGTKEARPAGREQSFTWSLPGAHYPS